MKRSEMLELLAKLISTYDFGGSRASWTYEKSAEHLLGEIEKAGMFPSIFLEGSDEYDYVWEREDEKK